MIRLCSCGLGLISFCVSYVAGVVAATPPGVRTRRSLLALGVGIAAGLVLGLWLRRLVLDQMVHAMNDRDEGETT